MIRNFFISFKRSIHQYILVVEHFRLIRENLRDTNGVIIKRRKVPFSALDVWKECKLLNDQDLLEPLIPCKLVLPIPLN